MMISVLLFNLLMLGCTILDQCYALQVRLRYCLEHHCHDVIDAYQSIHATAVDCAVLDLQNCHTELLCVCHTLALVCVGVAWNTLHRADKC